MAFEYQGFASLGVNLNRQKYGPLDISNVFTSENDLKYYLTKGTHTEGVSDYWKEVVPYPYEGQVLATVIGGVVSVYALALDTEGNFQTQEIGAKIETDDKTIKLVDGKLELVGLPADITGKTFVPSLVNGVLTWAEPDTSTAEGQAQEIEGLKTRATALETTVNGKPESAEGAGDAVVGLVDKVAANTQAIANEVAAREAAIGKATEGDVAATGVYAAIEAAEARAKAYADDGDADTVYDDTDLKNRVKAIEGDYLKTADKYDDTEVRGLINDLDTAIGDESNGIVKDIADNKSAIEAEVDRATKAEEALGQRIDAIDFVDADELATALEPINTALGTKAAQTDLEALEGRVDAFLTGTGATDALDSLQELIKYIDEHDDVELADIISDVEALQTKVDTGDKMVSEYVTAAIDALKIGDYAKAADLTALATRVEALEAKPFDTYAVKTEVESAIATAKQEAIDDADGKLANKLDSSAFETFKGENTTAIGTAKSEAIAAAKTETENQIATHVAAADAKYATKDELSAHEENVANDLLAYAKTETVNAALDKKIETGSIAHATETVAEGVTVNGTLMNIVVDAFTKAETRQYVSDTISQMTGGESAADVLLALNNYKSDNDERVGAIETKNGEQDTAIAAAQAQADKGVADAAKVASDLTALTTGEGAVAKNTREIEAVKGTISTVNETLTGKVTALENADTTIKSDVTALQTVVSGENGHASRIAALETKAAALTDEDTRLAGLIQANTDKFANYSDTTAMNKAIDDKIAAIPAVDLSKHATIEYVDTELGKKANATDVYTKTEADDAFMTQTEVDERINALIVSADPDGGKTIENIQNLVKYVDENAGEIAALITATDANTNKLAGIDTTVKGYVDDAIAAIVMPKASTEVTIAEDGTLGIGQITTDKIVNGIDTLVIDGGSSVK